ncbi:MAG: response regulator transcription factor [Chloroflexota bacterium]
MYLANADKFRILVVEDDNTMRRLVTQGLKQSGFQTVDMASAEEAIDWMKKFGSPHLALVDIDLQYGMSGLDFCGIVRQFSEMPIVMMTANDEPFTIIQAIDRFAEDYITKPFSIRELITRVSRVLRRIEQFSDDLSPLTQIDQHLCVDFTKRLLIAGENNIVLTPTESELLYVLVRNIGRVVTIEFLSRRVWPLETVDKHKLQVSMYRLRQKIKQVSDFDYIVAERGVGYRLVAGTAQ